VREDDKTLDHYNTALDRWDTVILLQSGPTDLDRFHLTLLMKFENIAAKTQNTKILVHYSQKSLRDICPKD
jgi:hypothetical protein